MAVKLVLMRLRRKTHPQVSLEGVAELSDANAQSFREIGCDDASLNGLIDRVCLERAIAKLPACYRLVFELHAVQSSKHPEIWGMMDLSVGKTKAPLHPPPQKA